MLIQVPTTRTIRNDTDSHNNTVQRADHRQAETGPTNTTRTSQAEAAQLGQDHSDHTQPHPSHTSSPGPLHHHNFGHIQPRCHPGRESYHDNLQPAQDSGQRKNLKNADQCSFEPTKIGRVHGYSIRHFSLMECIHVFVCIMH